MCDQNAVFPKPQEKNLWQESYGTFTVKFTVAELKSEKIENIGIIYLLSIVTFDIFFRN